MVIVTLPYDPLWTPLEWAKEHCASYITNDSHQIGYRTYDNSYIDYFFGSEVDAVFFTLRWS